MNSEELSKFWEYQAALRQEKPFFEDLYNYLFEKFNWQGIVQYHKFNEWETGKFELNLALNPNNSIRIGRIYIEDQRSGHCTSLIQFIDDLSEKYRIPYIEFGTVGSIEMMGFINKHDFISSPTVYLSEYKRFVDSMDWYRLTPFGNRINYQYVRSEEWPSGPKPASALPVNNER